MSHKAFVLGFALFLWWTCVAFLHPRRAQHISSDFRQTFGFDLDQRLNPKLQGNCSRAGCITEGSQQSRTLGS